MSAVNTVYLIHHSHTDVGYTSDQAVVWDLQERFLTEAIQLADKYSGSQTDGAFRWTIESTHVLDRWLKHTPARQIDRLVALENAGRVEVTGMFANITPLFDTDQLIESVQILDRLRRDYGFRIRHAMNCDVNGENWPLVDVLLDAGVRSFSMAVNSMVGGFPFKKRPYPFWWQGPSGRKILAHVGFPYDKGYTFGIGRDAEEFATTWWPTIEFHLQEINYPLSGMLVQSYHPFGDNGTAFEGFVQFIDEWNAAGRFPRLKLATPSMWVDDMAGELESLPSVGGDWTDYWNFGCGSSAREVRINRASRDRLRNADALYAAVSAGPGPAETDTGISIARSMARYRDEAWSNLNLWDEHTWGADISVWAPHCDDTASQWAQKAVLAYQARSLSLLLQRDGLAELGKRVSRTDPGDILLFNPLAWERKISGVIPNHVISPRGLRLDETAGRHFMDHDLSYDLLSPSMPSFTGESLFRWLPPTEVPGYGFTVISAGSLLDPKKTTIVQDSQVLENKRYRLAFDMQKGGITSLFDKKLNHEWVNGSDSFGFNRYLYEQVADRQHPFPRDLICKLDGSYTGVEVHTGWKKGWPAERANPDAVTAFQIFDTPLGQTAVMHLQAPGCEAGLRQSVFLPWDEDYIEVESAWEMGVQTHPDATYIPFHLNLQAPTVHYDLGGQAVQPGKDQLPGSCVDYYTVQRWVDFSDGERGMVIATPDVPMAMLGGFHLGDERLEFNLEEPLLLSWVTNTYWMTNFRAHQPGQVRARYRLLPYSGPFDENRNHRFGAEAALAHPLANSLGESPAESGYPSEGSLLHLPGNGEDDKLVTMHIKRSSTSQNILVRVANPTDQEQTGEIGSGLLLITRAEKCDLFENPVEPLEVRHGGLSVTLPARQMAVFRLVVTPA